MLVGTNMESEFPENCVGLSKRQEQQGNHNLEHLHGILLLTMVNRALLLLIPALTATPA